MRLLIYTDTNVAAIEVATIRMEHSGEKNSCWIEITSIDHRYIQVEVKNAAVAEEMIRNLYTTKIASAEVLGYSFLR